jgi:hypothetical protein
MAAALRLQKRISAPDTTRSDGDVEELVIPDLAFKELVLRALLLADILQKKNRATRGFPAPRRLARW